MTFLFIFSLVFFNGIFFSPSVSHKLDDN